ncbi:hypothetical protein ABBQ32_006170 [Trebouxia sp. C0010 RCD-2024]
MPSLGHVHHRDQAIGLITEASANERAEDFERALELYKLSKYLKYESEYTSRFKEDLARAEQLTAMLDVRHRLTATVPPPTPPPPPASTPTMPLGGHCTKAPQHMTVTSHEQASSAAADPMVTPAPSAARNSAGRAAPAPAQASSSSSATRVTDNTRESNEPEISIPAEAAVRRVRPINKAHAVGTS